MPVCRAEAVAVSICGGEFREARHDWLCRLAACVYDHNLGGLRVLAAQTLKKLLEIARSIFRRNDQRNRVHFGSQLGLRQ